MLQLFKTKPFVNRLRQYFDAGPGVQQSSVQSGAGFVLEFGPSLLLDFVTGEGGTFTPVTDSSMDLNFIDTTYDIESTSSPSYGPGQYFVQV